MTTRRTFALALVPLLACLAGCGSRSKTASASIAGKVTVNGAALTGGTLLFHGAEGGIYQTGVKGTGEFELLDIPPGEYTVTADNEFLDPNKKQQAYKGGSSGPPGAPAGGGSGGMKGKYGSTMTGPSGGPPSSYKGKGQETYVPEGSNVVKDGTYVPIPAKFKKKDTSGVKVTLGDGENKKDIAFDGK